MAADRAAPARWPAWAACAALGAGVAAIYGGTLRVPLLLDDHASLADNASLRHWSTALFPPPGAGVGGRPLLNLSFAVNARLGGYHLTNIAIHVAAACTLFALIRQTRARGRDALVASFTAAALWAAHPLLTESVTYLSQRAESLMGLCYLLTLLAYARSRYVSAALCCLAGMLTKETMATAPIAVLLYDRVFLSGSFAAAWRAHRKPLLALAATWVPLACLAVSLPQRQVGFGTGMPWGQYVRAECFAVPHYLRLACWPAPLVFDYGPQAYLGAAGLGLRVAVLALLVAAAAWLWKRRPAAGFCLAACFLVLAPTSSVIPIASQPVAESRMYLPLAALMVLVTMATVGRFRRSGAGVLLLAALALGGAARQRNQTYRSAETLWRDTIAKSPANSRAYENLGYTLEACAETAPARLAEPIAGRAPGPESPKSGAKQPADVATNATLAAAADAYRHALALNPRSVEAHSNLGSVLAKLHRPDEALAEFEAALRVEPEFAAARANVAILREELGNGLAAQGDFAGAARQFSASIAANPERDSAHYDLANALKNLSGREPEAAAEYEAALRLNPRRAETHNNYANLLLAQGRPREAIAHYQEALRLKPDFAGARLNLERAEARSR